MIMQNMQILITDDTENTVANTKPEETKFARNLKAKNDMILLPKLYKEVEKKKETVVVPLISKGDIIIIHCLQNKEEEGNDDACKFCRYCNGYRE